MTQDKGLVKGERRRVRQAIHWAFILWAVFSTLWLANSVRTQGLPQGVLKSSDRVRVTEQDNWLRLQPQGAEQEASVLFICGSGIAASAYVPMLRPLAEQGFSVYILNLPWRFAPLGSHKEQALDQAQRLLNQDQGKWLVAGHSLGGALAARLAAQVPDKVDSLALIATTHPKRQDLSDLPMPVIKVYGSEDGIAPVQKIQANRHLLPAAARFEAIEGANHSQFGHYGHQLFDGEAGISRQQQQARTRAILLQALAGLAGMREQT
ncbi:alpha/beta fold hydrolase [Bowmanella dokdonensis]|uniref:Alpha/beta fold hydrolase n=1 Tax=Bowmanella dokdonensis TaxID=751969 RepID=A0A939DR38_9ALTE|nr:alpha/beta fold hydrolase [Bowmanella dokdonensis]MBN7827240.1 alpha/beta fold hydrolase [Bowmanella dokdonensis]